MASADRGTSGARVAARTINHHLADHGGFRKIRRFCPNTLRITVTREKESDLCLILNKGKPLTRGGGEGDRQRLVALGEKKGHTGQTD